MTQSLNVLDRQWETAQALRQLWGELGGSLSGEIREGATPEGARVLVQHRDRPLAELLRPVMKARVRPRDADSCAERGYRLPICPVIWLATWAGQ